jgi:hypothetical protein
VDLISSSDPVTVPGGRGHEGPEEQFQIGDDAAYDFDFTMVLTSE